MNTSRLAISAVAVLALAVIGVGLYLSQAGSIRPGATAPPVASAKPSQAAATNAASPRADSTAFPDGQVALAPGTYVAGAPFPLLVEVPLASDGWSMWTPAVDSHSFAIYRNSPDPPAGHGLVFAVVPEVFSDACDNTSETVDPGPGTADLAAALAGQTGTESTPLTDVSLDGFAGTYVEYTFTGRTVTCDSLARWPSGPLHRAALQGEKDQVWVVDVDGVRLVVDAFSFPGTTDADLQALEDIVAAINIKPLP